MVLILPNLVSRLLHRQLPQLIHQQEVTGTLEVSRETKDDEGEGLEREETIARAIQPIQAIQAGWDEFSIEETKKKPGNKNKKPRSEGLPGNKLLLGNKALSGNKIKAEFRA